MHHVLPGVSGAYSLSFVVFACRTEFHKIKCNLIKSVNLVFDDLTTSPHLSAVGPKPKREGKREAPASQGDGQTARAQDASFIFRHQLGTRRRARRPGQDPENASLAGGLRAEIDPR